MFVILNAMALPETPGIIATAALLAKASPPPFGWVEKSGQPER